MTTATATQDTKTAPHAKRRARNSKRWGSARTYIFAAVIVIWCLLPAYWMVVTAFRDVGFTYDATPFFSHVTLDNFRAAFSTATGNHLTRALVNSLIVGLITTIISLLFGIFTSYALARLNFRAKFLVMGFILAASMFPGVALVTPLFQLFTNLNWIGTYQALIIPYISFALPLTIYNLVSFFRKIIMPLAAPGIFTTAILAFISSWNEFLSASQLSNAQTQTVTVAIASFTGSQPHQEPYTAVMAAATIVTIPLVIMVLVFQRQIVAGLTAGAVK